MQRWGQHTFCYLFLTLHVLQGLLERLGECTDCSVNTYLCPVVLMTSWSYLMCLCVFHDVQMTLHAKEHDELCCMLQDHIAYSDTVAMLMYIHQFLMLSPFEIKAAAQTAPCVCMQTRGQPWISFLSHSPSLFLPH